MYNITIVGNVMKKRILKSGDAKNVTVLQTVGV